MDQNLLCAAPKHPDPSPDAPLAAIPHVWTQPNWVDRPTITVGEAARLLGVSRSSAYEAARRGQIPTLRVGRRLLVPVPALLSLLGAGPGRTSVPSAGELAA